MNELVALAVALAARCDGCIVAHTAAAIRAGAARVEIADLPGPATAVNAGAALVSATRVVNA